MRWTFALVSTLALVGCDSPNTRDFDEDGVVAAVDCDDYDRTVRAPSVWFVDGDGDGWAAEGAETTEACVRPEGYTRRVGDCDDSEPTINPNVSEACNGADDDCDGFIDENTGTETWYADEDKDGFGDPGSPVETCDGEGDLVLNARDCDDTSADIRPGADEICDGVDNDCDARIDENSAVDAIDWYLDRDSDGYGSTTTLRRSCEAPGEGWADRDGDCDDLAAMINPGQDELCDGVDNNCDGLIDGSDATDATTWYPDDDSDGFGDDTRPLNSCLQPEGFLDVGGDCDDADRYISPETRWYLDVDGDGYGDEANVAESCTDPSTSSETYVANASDCDDDESAVSPDATEVCDGIDNDCNGVADGGDATDATEYFMDFDGDGYGDPDRTGKACSAPPGFTTDDSDCNDDDALVHPGAVEFCDEQDNDCDSLVDYDDPDVTSPTWYADFDEDEFGDPDDSKVQCEQPEDYVLTTGDCDDDNEDINPDATEVCDAGVDNDCDGLIDTADPDMSGDGTWYRDSDGDLFGDINLTKVSCVEPTGFVRNDDDCDDTDATKNSPGDCWDSEITFTTCGATGFNGPSQAQCDSEYAGTDLEDQVTVSDGKQTWTVPFDGTFRIEAYGASGGSPTETRYTTGTSKGAIAKGEFELERGDEITIAVGQKGIGSRYVSGGGGGSFVVDAFDSPLIIGGGGGGVYYFVGYYSSGAAGCPGLAGEFGGNGTTTTSSTSCTAKTTDKKKGGNSFSGVASGGGGMTSSGGTDTNGTIGGGGWKAGLKGGRNPTAPTTFNGIGGFGGGGGARSGGGGGGGYSGGNGGYSGGGGASFNAGASQTNTGNAHSGAGKVIIDYVGD